MNSSSPTNFAGQHILVVEPLKSFGVDLNDALKQLGNPNVTIVTTADDAEQAAATRKPDVIFCNIHLSDNGDGFDLAQHLHATHEAPIVFFSTNPDEHSIRYALRHSPCTPVEPPFDSGRLSSAMEDALYKFRKGITTHEHLRELRITDPLTGLGTPHKMNLALYHEWNRCTLEEAPLAFLLLHLENFENFERVGNSETTLEALTKLAQAIQTHCARRRDVVTKGATARFMILLPSTDEPGARHVAGQIVEAIRDLRLVPPETSGSPAITAAIGIAVVIPSGDKTIASMLEWAELQLDTAERRGGNRFHGGSMQPGNTITTAAPKSFLDRWKSWWTNKSTDRRDLH